MDGAHDPSRWRRRPPSAPRPGPGVLPSSSFLSRPRPASGSRPWRAVRARFGGRAPRAAGQAAVRPTTVKAGNRVILAPSAKTLRGFGLQGGVAAGPTPRRGPPSLGVRTSFGGVRCVGRGVAASGSRAVRIPRGRLSPEPLYPRVIRFEDTARRGV